MKFKCSKCAWKGEHTEITTWNEHDGPFCPKCGAGCPHFMSEDAQQDNTADPCNTGDPRNLRPPSGGRYH